MVRKYVDLHVHTGEGSLRDTGSTCAELARKAKELGATALAVTDHGTLTAIQDFRVACEKAEIKPIYGCELYVDIGDGARTHLIVLAKNLNGYQAISKVNTATAYNMHDGKPITTMEMLKTWFGKGSIGYGNVIVTSACMQGPLCRMLLQNFAIDKEIEKISAKRAKEEGRTPSYLAATEKLLSLEAELHMIKEEIAKNREVAETKWKSIWNKASRSGDIVLITEAEALKARVEKAIAKKSEIKERETKKNAEIKRVKEMLVPMEKSVLRYDKFTEDISNAESRKVSEKKALSDASDMLDIILEIFPEFYIELQYHGITEEAYAMPLLAQFAKEKRLPIIVSNDVHYANAEDWEKRHYMYAQYQNYKWHDAQPQDKELFMKTNEELTEILSEILPIEIIEEGMRNTFVISDLCNVEFEISTHYPKFPCEEGAKLHLRSLINKGKKKVTPWTKEYQKRLEYELRVIESMGFSDYLCIVEDFLEYARLVGKLNLNDERFTSNPFDMKSLVALAEGEVGEGCGPGRGSAAGSLVCYLVGITNINPVENELLFERFLNPERVTMPDIDSDIAPDVRPWVIKYLKNKYGEKSVCQIMTRSYFGAKSAIQAGARALGKKIGDEKAYLGVSLELSKSIDEAKSSLNDIEKDLLKINSSKPAKEIIRIAKLLEGLPSGYSTHAAGIIISDNGDVSDYTPLINISGAIDCQLDLNWVEPMGMLKLDLLGLRNLGIITQCEKAVQKAYGINLSMGEFPDIPEVYAEIFSKGETNGVFQFESDGMKKVLTNFGPESISDLTLLNAIFRPGPLQYIDDVTAVKKGEKEPVYIIPEMEDVLGATYGKPIYQEQIMQIFNRFAGFSLGEADIIRRFMSKKKTEKFMAYQRKFVEGLCKNGSTKKNAEKFWAELVNFSEYAFNKSHSRAYSQVAYATAYLKYKYPEAYACGLLNYTPSDKMAKMVLDTKTQKVSLKCPNINYSMGEFSLQGTDVIFGLQPIPQVAASAEKIIEERIENGVYASFKDFLIRVNPKKNVVENLVLSGAFDEFGERSALLAILPDLLDIIKKIREKKAIINDTESSEKRISNAKKSLERLESELEAIEIEYVDFNEIDILNKEKELLGYYISAHPMDKVTIKNKPLKDLASGISSYVTALVTDFMIRETKAGQLMATMTLSDKTDIIEAIVFPKDFERLSVDIEENHIYTFNGTLKTEDDKTKLYIRRVYNFKEVKKPVFVNCPSEAVYKAKETKVLPFKDDEGRPLSIYFEDTGKCIQTKHIVSSDIQKKIIWE